MVFPHRRHRGGGGNQRDAPPLGHPGAGREPLKTAPAVFLRGGGGFPSPAPSQLSALPCLEIRLGVGPKHALRTLDGLFR